jgi:hypothetical protein
MKTPASTSIAPAIAMNGDFLTHYEWDLGGMNGDFVVYA